MSLFCVLCAFVVNEHQSERSYQYNLPTAIQYSVICENVKYRGKHRCVIAVDTKNRSYSIYVYYCNSTTSRLHMMYNLLYLFIRKVVSDFKKCPLKFG